jgi:hypothetical protein
MLKEAIDYIYGKSEALSQAKAAKEIPFLSDGRTKVFEMGGTLQERPIAPKLRGHAVESVFDLCVAANKWGQLGTVWINEHGITLVIDDSDRRESVYLPLNKTQIFNKVEELHQKPKMEQAVLVRLLRREFRNSPEATNVLAAVRKVKFRKNESGYSNIQHGEESMGREVEAEVSGATDIPDSLVLPLAVYGNPGERENIVSVGFDLEVDVHEQRFVLKPMPDEVQFAIEASLASIKKVIAAAVPKEVTVLYGTP